MLHTLIDLLQSTADKKFELKREKGCLLHAVLKAKLSWTRAKFLLVAIGLCLILKSQTSTVSVSVVIYDHINIQILFESGCYR